jgi:hypothetical protein
MSNYVATYFVLVYLNILDTILTIFHLRNGAKELNPLVAGLIADFGIYWGMITIKFIFLLGLGILIVHMTRKKIVTKYDRLLVGAALAYAFLVLYSTTLLLYHTGVN